MDDMMGGERNRACVCEVSSCEHTITVALHPLTCFQVHVVQINIAGLNVERWEIIV